MCRAERTMKMTLDNLFTILAVLIAPLLAVQVQKWLERFREERDRKTWIFKSLMATRADTVSPQHVQALNMIDLEFRGKRYKAVTGAWKTYLDHLNSFPKDDEKRQPLWRERCTDLLAKLLLEMGRSLGYEFDEVHIRKGIYSPEAFGIVEGENLLIRRSLLNLLLGGSALNINMANFPPHEQISSGQKASTEVPERQLQGTSDMPVPISSTESEGQTA